MRENKQNTGVKVRELVSQYENAVTVVQSICQYVKDVAGKGCAPDEDAIDLEQFGRALDVMRKAYREVRAAAGADPSREGVPIQELAKTAERKERAAEELKRRDIIEAFLSVHARHAPYQDALAAFQKRAAGLLASKLGISAADVRGPELFLKCLDISDLDSERGEELLEKLESFYPVIKIHRGLALGEYSLPEKGQSGSLPKAGDENQEDGQQGPAPSKEARQDVPAERPAKVKKGPAAKEASGERPQEAEQSGAVEPAPVPRRDADKPKGTAAVEDENGAPPFQLPSPMEALVEMDLAEPAVDLPQIVAAETGKIPAVTGKAGGAPKAVTAGKAGRAAAKQKAEKPAAKQEGAHGNADKPATRQEGAPSRVEKPARQEDAHGNAEKPATRQEGAPSRAEKSARQEDAHGNAEKPAAKQEEPATQTTPEQSRQEEQSRHEDQPRQKSQLGNKGQAKKAEAVEVEVMKPEQARAAGLFPPLRPISYPTRSVDDFQQDIVGNPLSKYIVPWLTRFGAMTADQVGIQLALAAPEMSVAYGQDGILASISRLVDRNLVAQYDLHETGDATKAVMLMTQYCYDCSTDEAVEDQNIWQVDLSNAPVIASDALAPEPLASQRIEVNAHFPAYFTWIMRFTAARPPIGRYLRTALVWEGDHYSAPVVWQGKLFQCVVCAKNSTPPVEGNILYLGDKPKEFVPPFMPRNGSWFTVTDVMLRWNGKKWVSEKEDGKAPRITRIASLHKKLEQEGVLEKYERRQHEPREEAKGKGSEPTVPVMRPAQSPVQVHRKESGFKNDVKNIPMARVLLPLIATFGAVTESALAVYGRLLCREQFVNFQDRSLHNSLSRMVGKGMLASYNREPSLDMGETYCRTRYCYDYMRKPSVRNDAALWHAPYGNVPVVAEEGLSPVAFDMVELQGLSMACFLAWVERNFEATTYDSIVKSVSWHGSAFHVDVPWSAIDVPCELATPSEMTEPGRNYLVVEVGRPEDAGARPGTTGGFDDAIFLEDMPSFQPPDLDGGLVFCLKDDELYRWNETEWIVESDELVADLEWKDGNGPFEESDNPLDAFDSTDVLMARAELRSKGSQRDALRSLVGQFNAFSRITKSLRAIVEANDGPVDGYYFEDAVYEAIGASMVDEDAPANVRATVVFDETRPTHAPTFKTTVKDAPTAGVVLPLLYEMGAMTLDQIMRAARMGSANFPPKLREAQMRQYLRIMEDEELVASYRLGTDSVAYTLTKHAAKCMDRKLVRDAEIWDFPYSASERLQPAIEYPRETLEKLLDFNGAFLAYFAWARDGILALGPSDFQRILRHRSADNWYIVPLRWMDFPLAVAVSPELPTGTLEQDTLVAVVDESESGELFDTGKIPEDAAKTHLLFSLRRKRLFRWNGKRWLSEKQDRRAAAEQAEREEAERRTSQKAEEALKAPGQPQANPEQKAPIAPPKPSAKRKKQLKPAQKPQSVGKAKAKPIDPLTLMSGRKLATQLLEERAEPSDDPRWSLLVDKLIGENRMVARGDQVDNTISQALVLSKALALHDSSNEPAYMRLVLGLDSPIEDHRYVGDQIRELFAIAGRPALRLMTLLRALFAPDMAYDYPLRLLARDDLNNYEERFPGLGEFKALYGVLLDVADHSASSFSSAVLRTFANSEEQKALLQQIKATAGRLIDRPQVKSGLRATNPMLSQCFGQGSQLATAMEIIHRDDRKRRLEVVRTFSQFKGDDGRWSNELVDKFQDDNWQEATSKISGPPEVFTFLRRKLREHIVARVDVMARWLEVTDDAGKEDNKWAAKRRADVLKEIRRVLPMLDKLPRYDAAILGRGLREMENRLEGKLTRNENDFADLLRTGCFSLDEMNLPRMDEELPEFPGFEPWRNALRHIGAEPVGLLKALERISDPGDETLYDNLGQAMQICNYLEGRVPSPPSAKRYRQDLNAAHRAAMGAVEALSSAIGAAFATGQISSRDEKALRGALYKEDGSLSDMAQTFEESHNYGSMRSFLGCVRKMLDDTGERRAKALRDVIQRRKEEAAADKATDLLDNAIREVNKRNFGVAEEYINRFDTGRGAPESFSPEGAFADFMAKYNGIQQYCAKQKNSHIATFGVRFVEDRLGKTPDAIRNAKELLRAVPTRRDDANPERIATLLREIGLDASHVRKISETSARGGVARFAADIRPTPVSDESFAHPIAALGTQTPGTVDVLCLFGRGTSANELIATIHAQNVDEPAIVFFNGALDAASRRQLAEKFHKSDREFGSVVLVDWVLLLHLAMLPEEDRLRALVACTAPYTISTQPFASEGERVPAEMFFGRSNELARILDPHGPTLLHGGVLTGRTAILERARDIANHPESKEYAVLVAASDMRKHDDGEFAYQLAGALDKDGLAVKGGDSVKQLCAALSAAYKKGTWKRILVLVDDADELVEGFEHSHTPFEQLRALADLGRTTDGSFKCVFGGSRQMSALAERAAKAAPGLGEAVGIGPLDEHDAMSLLWTPLSFLGFNMDQGTAERLLVNTNHYPGNVHAIGRWIVENVMRDYGSYYNANGNPPYSLSDKQIADLMGNADLNEEIQEQILTCLGADPRGLTIARSVAYLTWDEPKKADSGYSLPEILDYAQLLSARTAPAADDPELASILGDLVDQRILAALPNGHYRLLHHRLKDIIGTPEQIEADIARESAETRKD